MVTVTVSDPGVESTLSTRTEMVAAPLLSRLNGAVEGVGVTMPFAVVAIQW